ncbi:PREDICTED: uncharacterized protein LOC104814974 [Tarenaya hassleriana]|uniref:uncharacterized protein LOC104814974 n=1 Tax=Tarenaya hassleriana TaxID=28532 RepID=UPI00053CA4DD|nr:PREDICTED: uncharacterized protein LOC104814974 [Tarenaya hassleriana]
MEVMMGPTFSIDVSASAEFVRDRGLLPPPHPLPEMASAADTGGSSLTDVPVRPGSGIWSGQTAEYSSESSSSIGSPGDSEDDDDSGEDDTVSSKERLQGLGSLSSLDDSLPIKRGLSNHYKGKSKSFGNLGEISSVKEVEKQENPLNKRRRLQICNKWSRRSFYAWQNPKSMPLLPVNEDEEEDLKSGIDEAKSSSDEEGPRKSSFKSTRGLKSRSCFALSDLQEEEDDDDDDE